MNKIFLLSLFKVIMCISLFNNYFITPVHPASHLTLFRSLTNLTFWLRLHRLKLVIIKLEFILSNWLY